MSINRSWAAYPSTYRAREMKILGQWISFGESGSVVGLPGCGRSNLLGFLCHRPEVLQSYLVPQPEARIDSAVLIPVDLHNLPARNLSTLYRVMLRSFERVCDQFEPALRQKISDLYQNSQTEQDPFLPQSALQELLRLCQAQQIKVVLVLNHFDGFYPIATPQMVNTLRGLRDEFKDTLCYIAGMIQEVAALPDPTILGNMYELLDNYVCWVGAMTEADSRNLIARATYAAPTRPGEADIVTMLTLAGGYPALLRAMCHWWLMTENRPAHREWAAILFAERNIQHRLARIWTGLTQEEQFSLAELQKLQTVVMEAASRNHQEAVKKPKPFDEAFIEPHRDILMALSAKGVCRQTETGWCIAANLLATYVARAKGQGRGRIWVDEKTGEIYQGQTLLQNLTTLERSVLSFLIKYPRARHTKTDIIIKTWPDEFRRQGVSDNSLYQVIFTIRQEIEPNPSQPSYLITWRGKPEGGYQFFPEGRAG